MVKQTIQIFCRLKPTRNKKSNYDIDAQTSQDLVTFTVPKDAADGFINNKKDEYRFKFERVFDCNSLQQDIFNIVAEPVIDNVLSGYNGTIFAYGQTGSGKTFTITGGPEKYDDRGIIPRSISYFFEQFTKKPDYTYTMHISYLEIYNENGYDLLNPQHQASKLEDLPKVTLLEDEDSNIHLRNLSVHAAANEEDALNLLFLGDTNRMIAETPMNQASTRSHCIFSIHITARETGSATIRKAKLHLVDLAGSERVSKTNMNGVLLTEAKYINLSLHYLEQVIVALAEKNRTHVPYRNSMMTSVLRDSLGGNCMTTMIATCSIEKRNLDESISTCRFAQRVALIKNEALINEELDPKLIILKLKKEVEELKNQLAITGTDAFDANDLSSDETERLKVMVQRYIDDKDADAGLNVGADMRKINFCFAFMKELYLVLSRAKATAPAANNGAPTTVTIVDASHYDSKEVKDLKETLRQRDNEISILVNMLKKEKKKVLELSSNKSTALYEPFDGSNGLGTQEIERIIQPKRQILKNMSMGRQEAFEIFKRDYPGNKEIEEQKSYLKVSYNEAKALGELISSSRNKLNTLKTKCERIYANLEATNSLDDERKTVEYEKLRQIMEYEKENYRLNVEKLKNMKTQIEHSQYLIEKSQVKLQKDFDNWWQEQCEILEQQQQKQQENSRQIRDSIASIANSYRINSVDGSSLTNSRMHSGSLSNISNNIQPSNEKERTFVKESLSYPNQANELNNFSNVLQSTKLTMTGDNQIDADITAFINARKRVLNQMKPKP